MRDPYLAGPDIDVLPSELPIPGVGQQPVNAFLLRTTEPVLIDTGMPVDRPAFLEWLWSLIDPVDLRWVVVTHDDRDHTGAMIDILAAAPAARIVCNGVSLIRLTEEFAVPLHRAVQVNPGQRMQLGDRVFDILRPPVFDSPGTIGLFDRQDGTLFSSDSFGTILPTAVNEVADASRTEYFEGFDVFNRAIAPWSAFASVERVAAVVEHIRRLAPARLLSSHGAVATTDRIPDLLTAMTRIPTLPEWLPASDLDVDRAIDAFQSAVESDAGNGIGAVVPQQSSGARVPTS